MEPRQTPTNNSTSFNIMRIPTTNAMDTDGDGIDDVYELIQSPLDPLDGNDGSQDFDNDGRSSLEEYQIGTDPSSPNLPPSITFSHPLNNSTFVGPTSIVLNVTASDEDGSLNDVRFYQGTNYIGNDITSPYELTWSNVLPGGYLFTAEATDNFGTTVTSTPVNIAVNIAPPYGHPSAFIHVGLFHQPDRCHPSQRANHDCWWGLKYNSHSRF